MVKIVIFNEKSWHYCVLRASWLLWILPKSILFRKYIDRSAEILINIRHRSNSMSG